MHQTSLSDSWNPFVGEHDSVGFDLFSHSCCGPSAIHLNGSGEVKFFLTKRFDVYQVIDTRWRRSASRSLSIHLATSTELSKVITDISILVIILALVIVWKRTTWNCLLGACASVWVVSGTTAEISSAAAATIVKHQHAVWTLGTHVEFTSKLTLGVEIQCQTAIQF